MWSVNYKERAVAALCTRFRMRTDPAAFTDTAGKKREGGGGWHNERDRVREWRERESEGVEGEREWGGLCLLRTL